MSSDLGIGLKTKEELQQCMSTCLQNAFARAKTRVTGESHYHQPLFLALTRQFLKSRVNLRMCTHLRSKCTGMSPPRWGAPPLFPIPPIYPISETTASTQYDSREPRDYGFTMYPVCKKDGPLYPTGCSFAGGRTMNCYCILAVASGHLGQFHNIFGPAFGSDYSHCLSAKNSSSHRADIMMRMDSNASVSARGICRTE